MSGSELNTIGMLAVIGAGFGLASFLCLVLGRRVARLQRRLEELEDYLLKGWKR